MPMTLALVQVLAAQCAPAISPSTMMAIVKVESGFDPLVIGVNGPNPVRLHPKSAAEATGIASQLIAAGANLDLGLAQINVRNLGRLHLSVADAFDPCRNLTASAQILQAGYGRAYPAPGGEQTALRMALSLYNTGDPVRGVRNGYVAKVTAATARIMLPLDDSGPAAAGQVEAIPAPPSWDVFASASATQAGFVLSPSQSGVVP